MSFEDVFCNAAEGTFPPYASDTEDYLFTSEEEIQRLLSSWGEILHLDDVKSDDEHFDTNNLPNVSMDFTLCEIIQRATSHIMSFLAPRYSPENIYRIPRIREIATYYACYKLTRRRGNQPLYEEEYIEAMDELELYRSGERYLNAPSNGPRAYIQSYVIDNRFTRNPSRVIAASSSSVIPGQHLSYPYLFFWL
jgi:hypothetical protein